MEKVLTVICQNNKDIFWEIINISIGNGVDSKVLDHIDISIFYNFSVNTL